MQRLNQQPQRVQMTPLWSEYICAAWKGHGTDSERTWRVAYGGKGSIRGGVGGGGYSYSHNLNIFLLTFSYDF